MARALINALSVVMIVVALAACAGTTESGGSADDPSGSNGANNSNSGYTLDGGQQPVSSWDLGAGSQPVAGSDAQASSGENPSVVTGSKSCAEIIACESACQDEACATQCFNQGSATGKSQEQALGTCQNSAAGGTCQSKCADTTSDACGACVFTSCMEQDLACYSGGKTGTLSCSQMGECMNNCGENDATCESKCISQGTAAAQHAMYALWICYNNAGVGSCATQCNDAMGETCYNCVTQACSSQESACQ